MKHTSLVQLKILRPITTYLTQSVVVLSRKGLESTIFNILLNLLSEWRQKKLHYTAFSPTFISLDLDIYWPNLGYSVLSCPHSECMYVFRERATCGHYMKWSVGLTHRS